MPSLASFKFGLELAGVILAAIFTGFVLYWAVSESYVRKLIQNRKG